MELRHLRYFVAIADQGSFRAAAEHVHISQPALSRQMQDLEAGLKAELFTRSRRGIALTATGEDFLVTARRVLFDLEAASRRAARIATGRFGTLTLGFVENATWDGPLPRALAAFKQQAPDVDLSLLPLNTPEQMAAIEQSLVDGGFVYMFDPPPAGFISVPVACYHAVVAVPKIWDFQGRLPCRLSDLKEQDFITFPRHVYPQYHDHLLDVCARSGVRLRSVQAVSTETAILSLVSSGMGAAIVNSANRFRPPALVRFIDVEDISVELKLSFVYRRDHAKATLQAFGACLAKEIGSGSV